MDFEEQKEIKDKKEYIASMDLDVLNFYLDLITIQPFCLLLPKDIWLQEILNFLLFTVYVPKPLMKMKIMNILFLSRFQLNFLNF